MPRDAGHEPQRYRPDQASDAWREALVFLGRHLPV